jgi:hypothetical protein
MPRRKATLRKMSPTQRTLATLSDDLKSIARRIDNILPKVADMEKEAHSYKVVSGQVMDRLSPETEEK